MVQFIRQLTAIGIFLLYYTQGSAQFQSNKGKEYWICFPKHTPSGGNLARMTLYITAACSDARGAIKINNYVDSFFAPASNQVIEKDIPYNLANVFEENVVTQKGIRITSDAKISVYAHIYAGVRSAAFMAMPVQYLGNNYFSCNYTQRNTGGTTSQLQVVATDKNTRVRITPRLSGVQQPPLIIDLPDSGYLYQFTAPVDISGSQIESIPGSDGLCKNIAVFSGSSGNSILSATCTGPDSYDPLIQQLYPSMFWGTAYALSPFAQNPAGYQVRVIASEDNTTVSFNGAVEAVLQKGEVYPPINVPQNAIQGDLLITADNRVSVAQYLMDNACNNSNIGDPDMVMVTPINYYPFSRTVYSSARQSISNQYLKITAPTIFRDSVLLNGASVTNGWQTINNLPGFSYNNIPLAPGNRPYTIATTPKTIFSTDAQIYGLGNAESYMYTGGIRLPVACLSINKEKIQRIDGDEPFLGYTCLNKPFNIYLHSPFPVTRIEWYPQAFSSPVTETSPVLDAIEQIGDDYFYVYKLNQALTGTAPGTYPVDVVYYGNYPGQCKKDFRTSFKIQVFPKPVANMAINHSRCLTDSVQFFGINPMTCVPEPGCDIAYSCTWAEIESWFWDFGDGSISGAQNPFHFYSKPGMYAVKLSATSKSGCPIDVVTRIITIDTPATAGFRTSAPYCEKQRIVFTDTSRFYNITDTLKEWHWNLGDGTQLIRTDSTSFDHTYSDTGWYTITLKVKTRYGCFSDTIQRHIYINATPQVKYGFTNACQNDPYVQFTDSSTIKDNTQSSFSYLWDFGDPAATPVNPNSSTLQKPTHQYTLAGTFNISLTATSDKGCIYKKDSVITISSAAASLQYHVTSSNQFCSNTPVLLTNLSSIATGSIRKLYIYWDAANNINDVTVDSLPFASNQYQHQYMTFNNSPASKNYTIKLVTISGQTCSTSLDKNINLHAMPVATFGPIAGICSDTPYVLLTQGAETTGLSGSGNYFGNAILPNGQYSVQAGGAGIYRFGYAYTSTAGCTDTAYANMQVFASPSVNAGADIVLPEDLSYTFTPSVTGNTNTYLWSPALYLDNALVKNATVVRPKDDVLYTIQVTTPEGCTATDMVQVKVVRNIAIPNTFTPNDDGINDSWLVTNLDKYPNCTVQVFTRTGQKVFESKGYQKPWNGLYKGKVLTTDTYYYIIELHNGKPGITGYVQIVR
jgi:gliding motility-associated-like protein